MPNYNTEMQIKMRDLTVELSSQAFFDNITDAEGKISQDLKLEVDNCGDPYCRVRRGRPTCSNTYFEDLPAGYEVCFNSVDRRFLSSEAVHAHKLLPSLIRNDNCPTPLHWFA